MHGVTVQSKRLLQARYMERLVLGTGLQTPEAVLSCAQPKPATAYTLQRTLSTRPRCARW